MVLGVGVTGILYGVDAGEQQILRSNHPDNGGVCAGKGIRGDVAGDVRDIHSRINKSQ